MYEVLEYDLRNEVFTEINNTEYEKNNKDD